jgi:hypothetical protein
MEERQDERATGVSFQIRDRFPLAPLYSRSGRDDG